MIFVKANKMALVAGALTLSACTTPNLGTFSGAMEPITLMDGSQQQTAVAMSFDKNCLGPTTTQMITYRLPVGASQLAPVASGTVSGAGNCIPIINAMGQIAGYAVMPDTVLNATAVSGAAATSTSISGNLGNGA